MESWLIMVIIIINLTEAAVSYLLCMLQPCGPAGTVARALGREGLWSGALASLVLCTFWVWAASVYKVRGMGPLFNFLLI